MRLLDLRTLESPISSVFRADGGRAGGRQHRDSEAQLFDTSNRAGHPRDRPGGVRGAPGSAFEGDDSVADVLLDLPVDHIFFTGSPAVGKVIMAAAARHLASVTLELGDKSPAIIDGTHDLAESARIVADGRHMNGGQMCFAVDYVWVRRDVLEPFLAHYHAWVDENLYADGRLNAASMTRILNERNLERVLSLVEDWALDDPPPTA